MREPGPLGRLRDAFLQAPERLALKSASVVIGLAVLLTPAQPASLRALLPQWFVYQWAGLLFLGGIATLGGIAYASRSIERLGVSLVGVEFFTYGSAILVVAGPTRGMSSAVIFYLISAACAVRLWMSGVGRRSIRRHQPPLET